MTNFTQTLGQIFNYFGIMASTRKEIPFTQRFDINELRRVRCDDEGRLEVIAAVAPVGTQDVNLIEVAGLPVLEGGKGGAQSVGGTNSEGSMDDGSWPVKIGAIVSDTLAALFTPGTIENLFADIRGRLHVRNAGYDETDDAQRASVINQPETDRDESPQIWVNTTNVAAAANYPSDAGIEVADRSFLSWQVRMRDGVFDIQVCDDGTNWVTATKSPVDNAEGTNGFDNTHYAEADVAVADFALDWERCGHRYIRLRFTPNNATNTIIVYCMQRAL